MLRYFLSIMCSHESADVADQDPCEVHPPVRKRLGRAGSTSWYPGMVRTLRGREGNRFDTIGTVQMTTRPL
jgi:hypothetical protein